MPPQRTSSATKPVSHSRVSETRSTYRLTCANCRVRKVKCDGATPGCRICEAHGKSCHYDKSPPMSQVLAMAKQIEELQRALHAPRDNAAIDDVAWDNLHQTQSSQATAQLPPPPLDPILQLPFPHADHGNSQDLPSAPTFSSTSAVQDLVGSGSDRTPTSVFELPDGFAASPMSADQLAMWQSKASEVCAVQLHLPLQKVNHLFETYWTWVAPSFMFVSRPQFLMSTASGERYSSPLLCAIICLQATRFTDPTLKDELLSHVHSLLGQEIHRPPTVALVQALLQVSAREIGNGSLNQAWLYSGMAFRIAIDMGIMVRRRTSQADATDAAVRGQLAWACFLWDKTISLYLGRAPSFPECPDFDPVLLDQRIEKASWVPYFGSGASTSLPPSKSYGITCFNNFCKLGEIINDVLQTIYAKKPGSDVLAFVEHTWERLKVWRLGSPPHLIISPGSQICPAPHIVSQNMLYYITTILLHRPFRNNNECRSICRQASAEVEHLLLLLEKSMGLTHVTYIMAYCAYTAATVAMLELHDGIDGSQARVNTFLRALYGCRTSCPGIQRSIDIIIKGLEYIPRSAASTSSTARVSGTGLPQPDPLPVFPIDEPGGTNDWNFDGQTPLPFGSLDPYTMDWTLVTDDVFNWDWQI